MHGSSLTALSDAWESVAAAKKELTNVDAKIRQSGIRPPPDTTRKAASTAAVSSFNHSRRSKNNPNIERRVLIDYPTSQVMHWNENIPPSSYPQPKAYPRFSSQGNENFEPKFDEFSVARRELHSPAKHKENYAPDFNYVSRDKGMSNTSLAGRVLLAKKSSDSNALNRLKEKINQQKMNASIANVSSQETFPEKHGRLETEPVQTKQIVIKEPMKRKVTQAPAVPVYKGFNAVDGHLNKPPIDMQRKYYPKESKLQKRDEAKVSNGKVSKGRKVEQSKMIRKVNVKGKMQRIVSPKKPVPSITTTSWRIGQKIRENLLRERKNKKVGDRHAEETVPVTSLSNYAEKPYEETDVSTKGASKSISHQSDKHESEGNQDTVNDEVSLPKDICKEKSENSQELQKTVINDNHIEGVQEPSVHSEEFKISISKSESELKDKPLSKNAMSIIRDMSEVPKGKSCSKNKVCGVIDTGLKRKKGGKTSAAVKRKSDEECYPKQKIRHYDQEEVKKYMQKKQAERKQQRLKEKQQKEQRKESHHLKLKELYNKQKVAVKENLEIGKRNVYGETFIKLSSKISSILSDPSYNSSHESTDVSTSKDISKEIPTYPIPQQASSPQRENTPADEVFKDSLDVTGLTNGDKSTITSLRPISPYKPVVTLTANTQCTDPHIADEQPGPDVPSKANRVAAIHNTAAALRKRLDMEAKRISCLVQRRQANLSKSLNETTVSTVPTTMEPQGFTGEIPGTHNIDEQAATNLKLQKMEEAAKKIQAFYRGHCARKSLHWKLPSGRTLYQAFEGAHRSAFLSDMKSEAPVTLASSGYPPITISNIGNKLETSVKLAEPLQLGNSDVPTTTLKQHVHLDYIPSRPYTEIVVGDVNLVSSDGHGSTASLISEALTISKNLQEDSGKTNSKASKRVSKSSSNTEEQSIDSFPSYSGGECLTNQQKLLKAVDEKGESLRRVLEKHKQVPGDEYSVINIFTRNYPSLRRQQLLVDTKVLSDSDTEVIIAEAYAEEVKSLKEDTADEYLTEQSIDDLTEQSLEFSMDETLTEQSIKNAAQPHKDVNEGPFNSDDTKSSISLSLAELPSKLQISSNVKDSNLSSGSRLTKKPPLQSINSKTSDTTADIDSDNSLCSVALSSQAFSDIDTHDLKPVFSSTQRSMDATERSKTPLKFPVDAYSVDFKVSKVEEEKLLSSADGNIKDNQPRRMSPNTLERKLRAEINLYESVGSTLQQVGEMERVRNVVDAQQETVSLAQVLKSRHITHQQELEKFSLDAKQRAMDSAQEVDRVKHIAAETSVNMMKSIAEVKSKAAEEIAASAVQLAQIQQQTASNTLEALNQVEQARQAATSAYKQLPDVGELAATIALNVTQQYKLEFERTHKHTSSKTNASSSTLPSDPNYTDDFEVNKQSTVASAGDKSTTSVLEEINQTGSSTSAGDKSTTSIAEGSQVTVSRDTRKTETSHTAEPKVFHELLPTKSVSAQQVNTATARVDSDSHSDTIVEELTFEDLNTPKSKTIKTEMETQQDGDGSEVLFEQKTLLGSVASVNEDSFSGNSEDKINSSLTEEELKHDFRMVLPSENHRRKSLDCVDNFFMGNDTSSDELLVSPRVTGKWMKKLRSKSPFADENTFTKFTANMVRQYIQEDEVRAKHQAALLELREKAIIEKTKAEMAYLDMQKKTLLKSKGTDEKMPPITKKQRAVLLRLQAEQAEIRRLKEAHKAASFERRSMLYQQKQIEKIRETTQKIWSKLDYLDKNDGSPKSRPDDMLKSESSSKGSIKVIPDISKAEQANSTSSYDHHSSDIPDEAPGVERSHTESIEESIVSEEKSKKDSSSSQTATSVSSSTQNKRSTSSKESKVDSVSESARLSRKDVSSAFHDSKDDVSSIAQDLKKLKYASGKKYLTDREKKLEIRKQQFTEIMSRESQLKDWRQKIIDEELRLKEDIRRVLEKTKNKDESITSQKVSKHSPKHSIDDTSNIFSQSPGKEIANDTLQGVDASSVKEDYSSGKDSKTITADDSIIEQVLSETSPEHSQSAALFTEVSKHSKVDHKKSSISHSNAYKYSTEIFENACEVTSGKKNISASLNDAKRSNVSHGSQSSARYSKKVEDGSLTENTTDSSDIEQRLKGLENELENRRLELERLRRKKEKELLRLKEQELKKALQDVEQQILRENKENIGPQFSQRTNEKSLLAGLSTRVSSSISKRAELPDVEITQSRSEFSQTTPEVKRVPSETELNRRNSELSDKSIKASRKTSTQLIQRNEDKSGVTNTSYSVKATDNEDIKSSTRMPDVEYTETDVKSEMTHSKSENKSVSNSKFNSISTATEMRKLNDKADDTSVSEHLISVSRNEQSVAETNVTVPTNLVSTPVMSKASTVIADMYGDDFEPESYGDVSPRSPVNKKSLLTEDDLSELSEEIVSEYSKKSEKDTSQIQNGSQSNVSKATHSSSSVSDELSEKSGSMSLSSKQESLVLLDFNEKSNQVDVSEVHPDISEKSFNKYLTPEEVSINKSDLLVKYEKDSTIIDTPKPVEAISYEDSFAAESSKLSTTAAGESLKVDSTRVVESKELQRTTISEKPSVSVVKEETYDFHVNDRVVVEGIMMGVIRFLGKTPFSPVFVAGIQLDEAVGTNDGTFQGTRYFASDEDCGIFTTLDRIKLIDVDEKEGEIEEAEDATSIEIEEILPSPTTSPDKSLSVNNNIQKTPSLTSGVDLRSKQFTEVEIPVADMKDAADSILKNKSIDQVEPDHEPDLHIKSSSSSDAESSEGEIPSPQKLDVGPMADGITESILKTLLLEAMQLPLSMADKSLPKSKQKSESLTVSKIHISKPVVSTSLREDSESMNKLGTPNRVDIATKKLIEETLTHMIRIRRTKQQKLMHVSESKEVINKDLLDGQNKLLLLIADEDTTDKSSSSEEEKDDFLGMDEMDDHSDKLEGLQSVQDHISAICGEDDEMEEISNATMEGRVLVPQKSFRFEEPILQIPCTITDTRSLVFSALNELTNDSVTHENLAMVEPSDEYLTETSNNKNYNEQYTKLYKKLIFDSTKSILCEINEFHEMQKQCKPPWMKAPRKTFSKFTHNSHMLDAGTLCQVIANYISTCLDLQDGRPSLEKLKRRLPLNLNKKDYVDAVLVEEIREEEPQWVNYDEDELKVKFQLADDILNNLLQEIVEILNLI